MEQELKRKLSSKSYGFHSYPRKDQAQGILEAAPSNPKDDKGMTIEKSTPKTSFQAWTSSIKRFKCLGRCHIVSQCPTKKTMIMKGQDIYRSQQEPTSFPSSCGSKDEVRDEESSEEVYPHEERDLLLVRRILYLVIYPNLKEKTSFIQDAQFKIKLVLSLWIVDLVTTIVAQD